jgi:hypothetical protein
MAPILGPTGSPLAARGWYDTEAIAEDDGTLYVAIERVHRIVRFDYAKEGLRARGQPIPVPREMRSLPANKGIEALVCRTQRAAPCRRVDRNFRTRPRCRRKHHRISDRRRRPGMFTVKRIDSFDVSDAALVPGGDLLLLERKFSWMGGLFIRIRRISLGAIKPGAVVDGAAVLEADMGQEIDNMEGLSVHRDADGENVLTLVSDDNFSILQRTLLLQFTLPRKAISQR